MRKILDHAFLNPDDVLNVEEGEDLFCTICENPLPQCFEDPEFRCERVFRSDTLLEHVELRGLWDSDMDG